MEKKVKQKKRGKKKKKQNKRRNKLLLPEKAYTSDGSGARRILQSAKLRRPQHLQFVVNNAWTTGREYIPSLGEYLFTMTRICGIV
jgi:hypothetical protein